MTLPTITGRLDRNLGYVVPLDTTTWADTTATTWAGFDSWSLVAANPLVWLADQVDLGSVTYFNLQITADYEGDIAYDIYTSTTGQWQGEEVKTSIVEGDADISAFYGRYILVAAKVYRGAGLNILKRLRITTTTKNFDIGLYDLSTVALSGSSSARVLPIGRKVSKILTTTLNVVSSSDDGYVSSGYIQADYFTGSVASGYFVSDYIASGYTTETTNTVAIASQVSKDRTNPTFCLRDPSGNYIDGVVDAIVKVMPEQYMFNGQLLNR